MVRTWIFQANPDRFDLDLFLTASPREGLWRAKQYTSEIEAGDTVFLWRAIGQRQRQRALAGIVAEAEVTTAPAPQRDISDFSRFWRDRSDATRVEPRATVRIIRAVKPRRHLMFDDIQSDPILLGLSILRAPNATNFKTSDEEAARLRILWERLEGEWNRKDEIDALLAYCDGTPLSDLALKVGRPLSNARKKIASFKSFDPSSPHYSPSIPPTDIWAEFFDKETKRLRREALLLASRAL
jgi:hypothetical protein